MTAASANSGAAAPRRGGRRGSGSGTRDAVLAAAQRQFAELGYDRTTMRSVAAEAGVDQKLVGYFFGSKQQLFVSATQLPFDPGPVIPDILGGDMNTVGLRLARFVVDLLEDPRTSSRILGLIRAAAAEPEAAVMVRDLLTNELWARGAQLLPARQPQLRISLIASDLIGLIMARYVICAEPLASLAPGNVVAALAPTLQQHLTGPDPLPSHSSADASSVANAPSARSFG